MGWAGGRLMGGTAPGCGGTGPGIIPGCGTMPGVHGVGSVTIISSCRFRLR